MPSALPVDEIAEVDPPPVRGAAVPRGQGLQPVQPHPRAMGFVRGRGACDHAALHTHRRWVVSMDLRDFFATITISRVLGVFRWLGFSDGLAPVLAALTTKDENLSSVASTKANSSKSAAIRS